LLAAAAAGIAIGGTAYVLPSSAIHERALVTLREVEDWQAGQPATLANKRLETWSNSLALVRERPVFGFGTGGFAAAYAKQVEGTAMAPAGHAENQYLTTAAQLGIVGLSALLALFGFQWYCAGRPRSSAESEIARGLIILMAIGCLFNPFLRDHTEALFYAWLSGLLYAGLRSGVEREQIDDPRLLMPEPPKKR
jgi:O-antigen ligase